MEEALADLGTHTRAFPYAGDPSSDESSDESTESSDDEMPALVPWPLVDAVRIDAAEYDLAVAIYTGWGLGGRPWGPRRDDLDG